MTESVFDNSQGHAQCPESLIVLKIFVPHCGGSGLVHVLRWGDSKSRSGVHNGRLIMDYPVE